MQEIANEMNPVKPRKVSLVKRVIVLGGSALAGAGSLVGSVSATTDINASVGPILDSVIALIPTIIALMIAAVPAIIVISIVCIIVVCTIINVIKIT